MLYEHVPPVWYKVSFVLRTDAQDRLPALVEMARATIASAGSNLAVQNTSTMRNAFDEAIGPVGQVVTLLSLLAGLALVLGAVGVYGVISHYVLRRSREYGIRIALGQQPGRVVREVVGRAEGDWSRSAAASASWPRCSPRASSRRCCTVSSRRIRLRSPRRSSSSSWSGCSRRFSPHAGRASRIPPSS